MKPLSKAGVIGLVLEKLWRCRDMNDLGMVSSRPYVLHELLSERQVLDACAALQREKLIRFSDGGFAHILPKGEQVVRTRGRDSLLDFSFGAEGTILEFKKKSLSEKSACVESIQKHVFLSSLLRRMWQRGLPPVEVLHCEEGSHGYDFVLDCYKVLRHVELKSTSGNKVKVSLDLMEKQSGCVLWITFKPDSLEEDKFRFFGGKPAEPLPDIRGFKPAKHTKADASGRKNERENIREIPLSAFRKLPDMDEVIYALFGF
jgi:hypothetical protein